MENGNIKNMQKITKAVLPVAGMGTRVMPLTLHQPKAMIGIVDKPMIHYIIDELLAAGIRHFILIISPHQKEFRKYFRYLVTRDSEWDKMGITFDFIVQKKAIGNGDALMRARRFIKRGERFVVAFSDDILGEKGILIKNMIKVSERTGGNIIALQKVALKDVTKSGIVSRIRQSAKLCRIADIVEKPSQNEAPSRMAIIGRYILDSRIFKHIQKLYSPSNRPSKGQEVHIADALSLGIRAGERAYGWEFKGKRFDAGSKIGILQAQVYFGLHHPELRKEFKSFLKKAR